jgi:hypothetical protein
LIAVVFMLVQAVAADAAVTIRTAPFNGLDVSSGSARCAVTNASTKSGVASATLYSVTGNVVKSFSSQTVAPHVTLATEAADLAISFPTHCECTVPSSITWRCTVLYATGAADNGASVTAP